MKVDSLSKKEIEQHSSPLPLIFKQISLTHIWKHIIYYNSESVDQGVMAKMGSTRSSGFEPHHQMQCIVLPRTNKEVYMFILSDFCKYLHKDTLIRRMRLKIIFKQNLTSLNSKVFFFLDWLPCQNYWVQSAQLSTNNWKGIVGLLSLPRLLALYEILTVKSRI